MLTSDDVMRMAQRRYGPGWLRSLARATAISEHVLYRYMYEGLAIPLRVMSQLLGIMGAR